MKKTPIHEEEWWAIYKTGIELKWFYFPTTGNKHIPYEKIIAIYYEEQNFKDQICKVKGWGMSLSPCWWACDTLRNCHGKGTHYYNVVIDCGECTYKGFTVLDMNGFLGTIRGFLQPETHVHNSLPF